MNSTDMSGGDDVALHHRNRWLPTLYFYIRAQHRQMGRLSAVRRLGPASCSVRALLALARAPGLCVLRAAPDIFLATAPAALAALANLAEFLVGVVDRSHFFCRGFRVLRVLIGVVLHRELVVGLFDLGGRCPCGVQTRQPLWAQRELTCKSDCGIPGPKPKSS